MRVRRSVNSDGVTVVELLGTDGQPVTVVKAFLEHLSARRCSPNTVRAYAYDLLHFWRFLAARGWGWQEFTATRALDLLEYLRAVASTGPAQRLGLSVAASVSGRTGRRLSPASVNRALAAVSSFYEFVIIGGLAEGGNPIERRPVRRSMRVNVVERLPRPLDEPVVQALLSAVRSLRDRALLLLMLEAGLRPGEVLGLHLEDIAYGPRQVTVRHRGEHPAGVRSKSRTDRVVDLHEGKALAALSAYVMAERPPDAATPLMFVIGSGVRRGQPLGYDGMVRMFTRCAQRAGVRQPWVTPRALRHTHATRI